MPSRYGSRNYDDNFQAERRTAPVQPMQQMSSGHLPVDTQKSIDLGTVYALQTAMNIYCDVKKSTIDDLIKVLKQDNSPEHFKSLKQISDRLSSVLRANIGNESIQVL